MPDNNELQVVKVFINEGQPPPGGNWLIICQVVTTFPDGSTTTRGLPAFEFDGGVLQGDIESKVLDIIVPSRLSPYTGVFFSVSHKLSPWSRDRWEDVACLTCGDTGVIYDRPPKGGKDCPVCVEGDAPQAQLMTAGAAELFDAGSEDAGEGEDYAQ